MEQTRTTKLNNGLEIPVLGLGTWQGRPGGDAEVKQAVKDAIDLGYRLFDCAHYYGNEKAIGEAIQEKISEGAVSRKDLFIVSKLWCNSHRSDLVEPALKTSLKNLKLDYLDLYLVHWPQGFHEDEGVDYSGPHKYSDVDYVSTWRAMEMVYRFNLTKAIGVSNFNSQQLYRIHQYCSVVPQVVQMECHPYLNQKKFRDLCASRGITVMAYSPLGGPAGLQNGQCDLLNDKTIKSVAERYKKSAAQILIKYNLQLNNVVIPKSFNRERLRENFSVFDFFIAPEDMNLINSLDCNRRINRFDEVKDHEHYPFRDDVEF